MNKVRINLVIATSLLVAFVVFTLIVLKVDVAPIGPENSKVGLATLNQFVFTRVGTNSSWYNLTKWLGNLALVVALGFAGVGFFQLVQRKSLFKVDLDLIFLAVFYFVVLVAYLFFEIKVINYRPVLLKEGLEASYPSTHTMLVLCIMATAMLQFKRRLKHELTCKIAQFLAGASIVFTIGGRLAAGVHWFTDILGGVLLSSALIMFYYSALAFVDEQEQRVNLSVAD